MSLKAKLLAALLAGDARMSDNIDDRRGVRLKLKELQEIAAEVNRGKPKHPNNPSDPDREKAFLDDMSRQHRKVWK